MSVQMVQQRLEAYQCRTALEEEHAVREITQEIVLAALGRGEFFKQALFQGGTCLRIFHGLSRFSEDLDFILREPNPDFRLREHIQHLTDELSAFGYQIEITDRANVETAVQTAFLKDSSLGRLIELRQADRSGPLRKIRIKLEVDTNPPAGSGAALEYVDFPFVSAVATQDMPSLFAGKMHALLCRKQVKGRDWYDFICYTGRRIGVNETFLSAAIEQLGPWQGQSVAADKAWMLKALEGKIAAIDWKQAANDARPFVRANEHPSLALWSQDLFLRQLHKWADASA